MWHAPPADTDAAVALGAHAQLSTRAWRRRRRGDQLAAHAGADAAHAADGTLDVHIEWAAVGHVERAPRLLRHAARLAASRGS